MGHSPGKTLVLHVAIHPQTGVWTVMRELVAWQLAQPDLIPVTYVLAHRDWAAHYLEQFEQSSAPHQLRWLKWPRFNFWYLSLLFSRGLDRFIERMEREFRPDTIVVHFHDAWRAGVFMPVRAKTDCPVVLATTYHGVGRQSEHSFIRRLVYSALARRTDRFSHIISVDEASTHLAGKLWGIQAEKFHIVLNGVAPTGALGCPYGREGTEIFTAGFIHSMEQRKQWWVAGEAVAALHRKGLPVRLLFAGRGPDQKLVTRWVAEHPECSEYLGFVPDVVQRVLPQIDALLLPSKFEGLPMTILEAMSCGIPTIATPVGGIPLAVLDGRTGFLVDDRSTTMADRLERLVRDREELLRMSERCMRHFAQNFSIQASGLRYNEVYGLGPK